MFALCEFIIAECERTEGPVLLRVGVDNTVAIGCWRRAFSYNEDTLALILKAHEAMLHHSVEVEVYYVSTHFNRADQYTRISEPHPFFQEVSHGG